MIRTSVCLLADLVAVPINPFQVRMPYEKRTQTGSNALKLVILQSLIVLALLLFM